MGKGSNNEDASNSANFQHLNAPNESFVKRVRNRVSGFLPQPTAWLKKWLSSSEQSHEDDDDTPRPPSKRRRLSPSVNDFGQQYNINSFEANNAGEISPIIHVNDSAIPGPSGLHNRHVDHFISSTPAVPPPVVKQHSPSLSSKVNGDDGSDSSDSTSGCSSLVPQADKPPSFSTKRMRLTSEETNLSPSSSMSGNLGKPSFSKPKYTRLDESLSRSRQTVPSFDLTCFRSHCKSGFAEKEKMSPFYSGPTMFGGASSYGRRSLATFEPDLYHKPAREFNVTPSSSYRSTETMGTTARKILNVLEKFSSPVIDAKSIPLRTNVRSTKRKLPQPYQELSIPQIPDLLRIKRKETAERTESQMNITLEREELNPVPSLMKHPSSTEIARSSPVKEGSSGSSSTPAEKEGKSEKSPSVPFLKVTSHLVKDSVPKAPSETSKPVAAPLISPQVKIKNNIFFTPATKTEETVKSNSSTFTFSKPIELTASSTIEAVPHKFSFSSPLEPMAKVTTPSSSGNYSSSNFMSKPSVAPQAPLMFMSSGSSNVELKKKVPVKKGEDVKPAPELRNSSVMDFFAKSKSENRNESHSVKVKTITPVNISDLQKNSFGNEFKLSSSEWECSECLVRNKKSENKCVACGQAKKGKETPSTTANSSGSSSVTISSSTPPSKGFGANFKPATDTWECKDCLVRNKSDVSSCVACTAAKPGSVPKPPSVPTSTTSTSFGTLFKKPEGMWECDACLVQNKSDTDQCVACGTTKPGAVPKEKPPAVTFSFGIPAETKPTFSFAPAAGTKVEQKPPEFSFGVKPSSEPKKLSGGFYFDLNSTEPPNSKPTFTFGVPPGIQTSEKNVEEGNNQIQAKPTTTVPPASSSGLFSSTGNENKKANESVAEKSNPPKAAFSFKLGEAKPVEGEPHFTFGKPSPVFGCSSVTSTSNTNPIKSPAMFKFGNSEETAKSSSAVGVASTEEKKEPPTKPVFEFNASPFSFGSTQKESEPKPLMETPRPAPNPNEGGGSIFGAPATESKPQLVFGSAEGNPSFLASSSGANSTNSPSFFSVPPASENKSVFGAPPRKEDWNPNPSNVFNTGGDTTTNVLGAPANVEPTFTFGTPAAPAVSKDITSNQQPTPFSFSAGLNQTQASSGFPFNKFADQKPVFQFNASNSPAQPQQSVFQPPTFGASAPSQPQSNIFGAPQPTSGVESQPSSTPFTFGNFSGGSTHQQADPKRVIAFSAQPSGTSGPNFLSQNAFSSGSPFEMSPTFAVGSRDAPSEKSERKIKKAIRRTTNRH